ncbi:MAG: hypothetical protein K5882_05260 [Bacteroidales bacterium]|nr:hypothetical protein [Bacteroidales bacterium]
MMDNERYQAEQMVLRAKLPANAYRFMDMGTAHPYILMAARTNKGNVYTLRIELSQFPTFIPKAFVTKMLYSKDGQALDDPSSSMHTLSSEKGWTRICHYGSASWNPYVSIYKIYVKCRLWLEMYELHLKTGKHIDYYLKHQA